MTLQKLYTMNNNQHLYLAMIQAWIKYLDSPLYAKSEFS